MFDATQWAGGALGIDDGWQEAEITEVMQKVSGSGNTYVSVTFQCKGGRIWENLNVLHPRDNVREIAYKILANMCLAAGMRSIRDPSNPVELEGARMRVLVVPPKDLNDRQSIKAFEPLQRPEAPVTAVESQNRLNAPVQAPQQAPAFTGESFEDDIPFN